MTYFPPHSRPLAESQQQLQPAALNNKLIELKRKQGSAEQSLNELFTECEWLRNENKMLWDEHRRLIESQNTMSDNMGNVLGFIYDMYMRAGGNPDSHFANAVQKGKSDMASIKISPWNNEVRAIVETRRCNWV